MARDKYDYTHGDTGQKPGSSLNFQAGARPDSEKFDWWWYTTILYLNGHADEFTRLDSDDDGIVDEADYAASAGDADTISGETLAGIRPSVSDSDTIQVNAATDINVAGDLSATDDGDGTATLTVTTTVDTHVDVSDSGAQIASDVSDINFGSNFSVIDDGDGSVTINFDGNATTYKDNDIDSDGDGRVDAADHATNADDADTVDGQHAADFYESDGNHTFVFEKRSSAPSSPAVGRAWYRTDKD